MSLLKGRVIEIQENGMNYERQSMKQIFKELDVLTEKVEQLNIYIKHEKAIEQVKSILYNDTCAELSLIKDIDIETLTSVTFEKNLPFQMQEDEIEMIRVKITTTDKIYTILYTQDEEMQTHDHNTNIVFVGIKEYTRLKKLEKYFNSNKEDIMNFIFEEKKDQVARYIYSILKEYEIDLKEIKNIKILNYDDIEDDDKCCYPAHTILFQITMYDNDILQLCDTFDNILNIFDTCNFESTDIVNYFKRYKKDIMKILRGLD